MSVISRFKTFLFYSLENRLPFLKNKNKQNMNSIFFVVARIRNFLVFSRCNLHVVALSPNFIVKLA
jgi:hypothetical protein